MMVFRGGRVLLRFDIQVAFCEHFERAVCGEEVEGGEDAREAVVGLGELAHVYDAVGVLFAGVGVETLLGEGGGAEVLVG